MSEKKPERRSEWHMDKKITIGLILAVSLTFITSAGQLFYVVKTLDTDPPLIERIIRLELHISEQGRVNTAILDELKEAKEDRREARKERAQFIGEQKRRTPMVDYIEKRMGK